MFVCTVKKTTFLSHSCPFMYLFWSKLLFDTRKGQKYQDHSAHLRHNVAPGMLQNKGLNMYWFLVGGFNCSNKSFIFGPIWQRFPVMYQLMNYLLIDFSSDWLKPPRVFLVKHFQSFPSEGSWCVHPFCDIRVWKVSKPAFLPKGRRSDCHETVLPKKAMYEKTLSRHGWQISTSYTRTSCSFGASCNPRRWMGNDCYVFQVKFRREERS